MTEVEVLIFAARDDPHDGWARATTLLRALVAERMPTRLVDRMSSDFEDLSLVARYGAVGTPFVIIREGRQLLGRRHGVPTTHEVLSVARPT